VLRALSDLADVEGELELFGSGGHRLAPLCRGPLMRASTQARSESRSNRR